MLNGNLLDANNFEVPFASSNELSIEAPKYIGTKESFIVNNTTEAIDFNIKLLPKSKNKAILNSLLFPGYGQFYYESKTKGNLFSITAASLIVLLIATEIASAIDVAPSYKEALANSISVKSQTND